MNPPPPDDGGGGGGDAGCRFTGGTGGLCGGGCETGGWRISACCSIFPPHDGQNTDPEGTFAPQNRQKVDACGAEGGCEKPCCPGYSAGGRPGSTGGGVYASRGDAPNNSASRAAGAPEVCTGSAGVPPDGVSTEKRSCPRFWPPVACRGTTPRERFFKSSSQSSLSAYL